MAIGGKGALYSKVPYTRFSVLTTGQTFGPFAATPSEPLDALIVANTLTALSLTGSDGVAAAFTTFPPVGTVLEVSPTAVSFTPAGSLIGCYRG